MSLHSVWNTWIKQSYNCEDLLVITECLLVLLGNSSVESNPFWSLATYFCIKVNIIKSHVKAPSGFKRPLPSPSHRILAHPFANEDIIADISPPFLSSSSYCIFAFLLRYRRKQAAVEFRTIIIMLPKKEANVYAYITALWVLSQCSFTTNNRRSTPITWSNRTNS